MDFNLWFIVAGVLFVVMALSVTTLGRLPLTTSILYLAVGITLGPMFFGVLRLDPLADSGLVERVSEVAVIVSLFTAGLKLRLPLRDDRWRLTLRLAFVSMTLTVCLIAAAGVFLLGLSAGAAVLLGAVLAPTDPVLASDVQTEHAHDPDRLRFSLTGEAGLNDGTAFPFVMLGLGLLGLHELGAYGWRWLAVDVLWAVAGGLAVGWVLGTLVGRYVLHLRSEHEEAVGTDDFLALGLIALSYGLALLAHTYGFLAVFAAGVALRRVERLHTGDEPPEAVKGEALASDAATDPEKAPAYMAQAVLGFNEQLERVGEVIVVVLVGAMLTGEYLSRDALWFVPLLFLFIRPASVLLGLAGAHASPQRRRLIAWFGIRGIGSVYYLTYAVSHGLAPETARSIAALTLTTIAVSAIAHGLSVTPLMRLYEEGRERKRG
ncbi:MAG TPA: sodium:proton antiporter [Pyrinomonadaceae bacterium]|jgi:NhaP-type Na+/H+ or K+/H+ antiporter